jgi:hypothetical protein
LLVKSQYKVLTVRKLITMMMKMTTKTLNLVLKRRRIRRAKWTNLVRSKKNKDHRETRTRIAFLKRTLKPFKVLSLRANGKKEGFGTVRQSGMRLAIKAEKRVRIESSTQT